MSKLYQKLLDRVQPSQNLSKKVMKNGTAGLQPYTYKPLSRHQRQIRVLELWPGSFESDIHIVLRFTRFGHSSMRARRKTYEALSYTWGSIQDPATIFVHDGKLSTTLCVTRNLEEALRYLRHEQTSRTLWIDALCINQQNVQERSDQVAIMADIYANAAVVLIWLGPQSEDSDISLDCVDQLKAHVKIVSPNLHDGTLVTVPGGDPSWTDEDGDVPFTRIQMVALTRLFFRPYFERLWVWQEIHSNHDQAMVLCGQRRLPWSQLSDFIVWLGRKTWLAASMEVYRLRPRIHHLRPLLQINKLPMLLALHLSRWCKCSDPRDRVFAIANLANYGGHKIQPDYSKNVADLYAEVACSFLSTETAPLDLLHYVESLANNIKSPSWVPDWSSERRGDPSQREFGRADANTPAAIERVDSRTLTVFGRLVGRVQAIVPFLTEEEESHRSEVMTYPVELVSEFVERAQFGGIVDTARVDRVEKLLLTLFHGVYAERFVGPCFGTLFGSVFGIKDIIGLTAVCAPNVQDASDELQTVASRSTQYCEGKAVFASEVGTYGVAPLGTEPGDSIAVLLGHKAPVVVRALSQGNFLLLGDAHYDGVMDGEAILGPLPAYFKIVYKFDATRPAIEHWYFRDERSGRLQTEDPRLMNVPLPDGWQKVPDRDDPQITFFWHARNQQYTRADPRLTLEELQARGLELQTFTFV